MHSLTVDLCLCSQICNAHLHRLFCKFYIDSFQMCVLRFTWIGLVGFSSFSNLRSYTQEGGTICCYLLGYRE